MSQLLLTRGQQRRLSGTRHYDLEARLESWHDGQHLVIDAWQAGELRLLYPRVRIGADEALPIATRLFDRIEQGARSYQHHIVRRAVELHASCAVFADGQWFLLWRDATEQWRPVPHRDGWLFCIEDGAIVYRDEDDTVRERWPLGRVPLSRNADGCEVRGVVRGPLLERVSKDDLDAFRASYCATYSTAPEEERGLSWQNERGWFTAAGNPYLCRTSVRGVYQGRQRLSERAEIDLLAEIAPVRLLAEDWHADRIKENAS